MNQLGSGEEYEVDITYRVQEKPGGIAQALSLCESFAGDEPITVCLGDNIFEDDFGNNPWQIFTTEWIDEFFDELATQVETANANRVSALSQFNAGEANAQNQFNASIKDARDLEQAMIKALNLSRNDYEKMSINARNIVKNNFDEKIVIDSALDALDSILKK